MAKVKVYSTSWCPYCHALMSWLDELGVEYEEIDAENMDFTTVPVTDICGTKIIGFDRPAIKKALKKSGLI
ncbi:glutaredoxin family protein [Candidatus Saccharibacteria bacterium]|nr:glutaredoxin family protein [Candidatus Saccharibacteria bacterium]